MIRHLRSARSPRTPPRFPFLACLMNAMALSFRRFEPGIAVLVTVEQGEPLAPAERVELEGWRRTRPVAMGCGRARRQFADLAIACGGRLLDGTAAGQQAEARARRGLAASARGRGTMASCRRRYRCRFARAPSLGRPFLPVLPKIHLLSREQHHPPAIIHAPYFRREVLQLSRRGSRRLHEGFSRCPWNRHTASTHLHQISGAGGFLLTTMNESGSASV